MAVTETQVLLRVLAEYQAANDRLQARVRELEASKPTDGDDRPLLDDQSPPQVSSAHHPVS